MLICLIWFKIKRALAQWTRSGKTEYQLQFKGEPAQNSIWIPFDQLNAYTPTLSGLAVSDSMTFSFVRTLGKK
jgi:hypothetical protein